MLADAFELYANAYERSILLRDFYGKEASLFTVTSGSQFDKEQSKRGLKGLLDDADKDRRRRLMSAVKENLVSMLGILSSLGSGMVANERATDSTILTKGPYLMQSCIAFSGSIYPLLMKLRMVQNVKNLGGKFLRGKDITLLSASLPF